jgi:hypothetical protein
MSIQCRGDFAHEWLVRAQSPTLGPRVVLDRAQAAAPPRLVARETQSRLDEAIDLIAEDELGERELLLRGQRLDRLVADAEEDTSGHRLLVVLYLLLHEERVFVLQRLETLGH